MASSCIIIYYIERVEHGILWNSCVTLLCHWAIVRGVSTSELCINHKTLIILLLTWPTVSISVIMGSTDDIIIMRITEDTLQTQLISSIYIVYIYWLSTRTQKHRNTMLVSGFRSSSLSLSLLSLFYLRKFDRLFSLYCMCPQSAGMQVAWIAEGKWVHIHLLYHAVYLSKTKNNSMHG